VHPGQCLARKRTERSGKKGFAERNLRCSTQIHIEERASYKARQNEAENSQAAGEDEGDVRSKTNRLNRKQKKRRGGVAEDERAESRRERWKTQWATKKVSIARPSRAKKGPLINRLGSTLRIYITEERAPCDLWKNTDTPCLRKGRKATETTGSVTRG